MSGIQEAVSEALKTKIAFTIPIFGGIPIGQSVLVSWLLILFIVIFVLLSTRNLKQGKPGKAQAMLEMGVEFLNNFTKENIGARWRSFAPWLGTIAIYIGFANLISLFGLTPPTKDISVTAALAFTSVCLIYFSPFRILGLRRGLHKFAEPLPILIPINVMEIGIRPLSLCMRLFGNVLGSFVIMELIKTVLPIVVPMVFSMYFDVFDGIIQTIVFVFLTALFTGEGIEEEA